MSKSRFGGGTLGNGRWDEEEHPRGRDGRFASGGGGGMSRAAQARKKLFASIKRKIENGEPVTDYEREIAIKHILPKEERDDFVDKEEYSEEDENRVALGLAPRTDAKLRRESMKWHMEQERRARIHWKTPEPDKKTNAAAWRKWNKEKREIEETRRLSRMAYEIDHIQNPLRRAMHADRFANDYGDDLWRKITGKRF